VTGLAFSYTKLLPWLISNEKVINYIEKTVDKNLGVNLDIQKPYLKTGFTSDVEVKVDKVLAKKNEKVLVDVANFDTIVSFKKIFDKKFIVKKLGADKIYVDTNAILEEFPTDENKTETKSDFDIDFYDSILYINDMFVTYSVNNGAKIQLKATNLNVDNTQKLERFVHFNFDAKILKNNNTVHIEFNDDNKVIIKNKHIYVNDCPFIINHSKMFFNAQASNDKDYVINVFAKRFFIPDIIKLLQTDVIENNINEPLEYIKNINGDIDFNFKITYNDFSGDIKLNRLSANILPLANMPFLLNSGDIKIFTNDIILKDFKGNYDKKNSNEFFFNGTVNDYLKTLDTNIDMTAVITNDFVSNYLSKTAQVPLTLKGKSRAKILIHSKNNDIDVTMMGKIAKGDDILVDGASLSPTSYDRALKTILHIKGDNVNIETIKYFIAKELTKASKGIKPILTLDGDVRLSDGKILNLGFDIPKPLPSEFLNVLISQKLFKGGQFAGNMRYIDNGKIPYIETKLTAEKIRIPSQRLFLKSGEITADKKHIHLKADGKYRKCPYSFNGELINEIKFPIVVKNTELTVDSVDVERLMQAFVTPVEQVEATTEVSEDDDNPAMTFDLANLIIENADLKIIKGSYKDINFSNVNANMSLDKNSVFKMKSNKFEIAEGHSSADVTCDLKNQIYNLKLGIKEVNSDLISTVLLNLSREISGKASGLIELNTDKNLKLNGSIKFIVKDGTIQKIGLVEYVLKFASLFRNPLAMISPSVFSDLVNIPDGSFEKITGDLKLKDNKIEMMKIKSYSSTLSAFIIGSYNLENSDAILRIYTKFSNKNKGVAGVLRNISLNTLANRIPLNSRNDSNYYEAELSQLPAINADEKDCQVFLTKVDGDIEHNNFISSLKKIK
jgi:hypothetical protein